MRVELLARSGLVNIRLSAGEATKQELICDGILGAITRPTLTNSIAVGLGERLLGCLPYSQRLSELEFQALRVSCMRSPFFSQD